MFFQILKWTLVVIVAGVLALFALVVLAVLFGPDELDQRNVCPRCKGPRSAQRAFAGGWVSLVSCECARRGDTSSGCSWVILEEHSKGGVQTARVSPECAAELLALTDEEAERRVARVSLWDRPVSAAELERRLRDPGRDAGRAR